MTQLEQWNAPYFVHVADNVDDYAEIDQYIADNQSDFDEGVTHAEAIWCCAVRLAGGGHQIISAHVDPEEAEDAVIDANQDSFDADRVRPYSVEENAFGGVPAIFAEDDQYATLVMGDIELDREQAAKLAAPICDHMNLQRYRDSDQAENDWRLVHDAMVSYFEDAIPGGGDWADERAQLQGAINRIKRAAFGS